MDFAELVRTRESVRSYEPRPVPAEILARVLETTRLAPSAANRQPWRIIVVQNEPLLSKVKSCYQRDWLKEAPQIVVVTGSVAECWKRQCDGYQSIETDLTILMDHFILAAANEGLGTCWIAAFDPQALKETLMLRDDERVFAFTPLGYPGANHRRKEKDRRPLQAIVEYR